MWDLDNEDNYILSLDGHNSYDPNENVMCISYSQEKGLLYILCVKNIFDFAIT